MKSRLDWRVSQSLARIVRDEGYQVLHAHTPRSLLVAAMAVRKCDVPLVYHVHSPALRDSTSRWRNWCNGRIEKWCLRNVSALITVSASLRREMQRHCGSQQRIHVVPNGVPAVSSGRTATPPGDRWTVGTVALFRPRKGTEVLLTALGQLRRLGYPLHLRAVGPFETVEYESHLRRHVEQLQLTDHVQWVGFTRDVAAELAQMDLFVLPSLFGEGLPMVVLEAMAAGVPVIGTRVEGVPEAVVDGQTGLLAEPGCADSLRRSVQAVLDGRVGWSTLRENGLRRHAEGFSDHAMAAGVANVYREVLC